MASYTVCHRCGQPGHYERQCSAAPPPDGGPLQGTPSGLPASHVSVTDIRRPPEEIADYPAAAAAARGLLGWSADQVRAIIRARALEQAGESRRGRYAWS